jgi:hypothetical protein
MPKPLHDLLGQILRDRRLKPQAQKECMNAWTKVVIELHKRSLVAMYSDLLHEAGKIFPIHHLGHVGASPRCNGGGGAIFGEH